MPEDPSDARSAAARGGSAGGHVDLERGLPSCPFLRSDDGGWSSVLPSRDLRCWAVHPAAQLAVQKQRQLCVLPAHAGCPTFAAATLAGAPEAADGAGSLLWPDTLSVPVALESVRARSGSGISIPRAGGQAALVGLMAVALVVLVLARVNPLASSAASPAPVPSPSVASAASSATTVPTTSPIPTVAVTPTPAPTPTAAPTPTPAPTASPRTYKVRSGDTIAGIAARLHSTVKAIVDANNIVDPRTIHPGQVLIIP
jgi:LysM repeat protein